MIRNKSFFLVFSIWIVLLVSCDRKQIVKEVKSGNTTAIWSVVQVGSEQSTFVELKTPQEKIKVLDCLGSTLLDIKWVGDTLLIKMMEKPYIYQYTALFGKLVIKLDTSALIEDLYKLK